MRAAVASSISRISAWKVGSVVVVVGAVVEAAADGVVVDATEEAVVLAVMVTVTGSDITVDVGPVRAVQPAASSAISATTATRDLVTRAAYPPGPGPPGRMPSWRSTERPRMAIG
jgi:hypothetical protein